MGDNLAEQLFNAFWAQVVSHGLPKPAAWRELHETQRQCWEAAATAARRAMSERLVSELKSELGDRPLLAPAWLARWSS